MIVRAEKLRTFHADGPVAERCAFSGAGNDSDMLGHDSFYKTKGFAGRA